MRIRNFGFNNFSNDSLKENFIECFDTVSISYLTSAIEFNTQIYDYVDGQEIYSPIWNSHDLDLIHQILYDEETPPTWIEYSSNLETKYNQNFNALVNELNTPGDEQSAHSILRMISSFHEMLYNLKNDIRFSPLPLYLSVQLLPIYISFFSRAIYYILARITTHTNVQPAFNSIVTFLNTDNSSLTRDYSNIFLAFEFYLAWITMQRQISRTNFLIYYSQKQISTLNRKYTSNLCKNEKEALRAMQENLNINIPYHIKNVLKKYAEVVSRDYMCILDTNDSLTWEILYDCIQNQSEDSNIPIKHKCKTLYYFSDKDDACTAKNKKTNPLKKLVGTVNQEVTK